MKDEDFKNEWENYKESISGLRQGIPDQSWTRDLLLANIRDPNLRDFQSVYFELPPKPICACGVFTFETTNALKDMRMSNPSEFANPTTAVFFNFIPFADKSVAFFMFPKNKNPLCDSYFYQLSLAPQFEVLHSLSDILLVQIENWICSKSFFQTNIRLRETLIKLEMVRETYDERGSRILNIFENGS